MNRWLSDELVAAARGNTRSSAIGANLPADTPTFGAFTHGSRASSTSNSRRIVTIFAAAALITLAAGASFLAPPEVDYGREAWNALQRATERSVAVVEEWTESLRAFLRRAAESDAVTPGNIAAMHQTIEPDEVEALRAENERLQERLSRIEAAIALSTAGAATATPKAPEPTTAADRASNND